MKKLVLTVTASLACLAAFAQGKINFNNDSLHLIYFTSDTARLDPADVALAGRAATTADALGGAVSILVDLYAGTSSDTLALVKTTGYASAIPGRWTAASTTLPSSNPAFPGGQTAFFQVQAHESTVASAAAAQATTGVYYAFSSIFTAVPNANVAVNLYASPSTWAAGTFALDASAGAGTEGAIELSQNAVPEPASFALVGLGIAAVAIFRRRKQ